MTSRRKPSRTMRIFSSGVYLRRVKVRTRRMKARVSWVRVSACCASVLCSWDTLLLSWEGTLPLPRSLHQPSTSSIIQGLKVSHFC